jgi:hypothetical protein
MISNEDLQELSPNKNFYKLMWRWVVGGVLLALILLPILWILGWVSVPFQQTSPDLVRQLSQAANEAHEGLLAQSANIDNIETTMATMVVQYGEDRSSWPQGKSSEYLQLAQQRQNLITAYNQACGEYRALWNDEWRNLPAPDDLPTNCEMMR